MLYYGKYDQVMHTFSKVLTNTDLNLDWSSKISQLKARLYIKTSPTPSSIILDGMDAEIFSVTWVTSLG